MPSFLPPPGVFFTCAIYATRCSQYPIVEVGA